MGYASTIYDVRMQYNVEGNAGSQLDNLAMRADRASRASDSLKGALLGAAAALGIGSVWEKGKEAFVGFNSEMERLKISMSSVIQANLGGSLESAQQQAKGLFKEFQDFAVKSPLTTKEVAEFGQNIEAGVFAAGGSMEDFIKLTEQGSLVAQVLGKDAHEAGVNIAHMMQGDISSRMLFATQVMTPLLREKGISKEQFKGMGGAQRIGLVEEAFGKFAPAAEAFQNSFSGQLSTLKDRIQIALGEVGLPLFKAITKEIAKWNDWLVKNGSTLQDMGEKFANGLVAGFQMLKDVGSFLADNKDTIKLLAELFVGLKVAKIGAGLAEGVVGVVGSLTKLMTATDMVSVALAGAGGLAAVVGGVIAALIAYKLKVDAEDKAKKIRFAGLTDAEAAFQASGKGGQDREKLVRGVLGTLIEKKVGTHAGMFNEAELTAIYRQPTVLAGQIADKMGFMGQENSAAANAIIHAMQQFNSPEALIKAYKQVYEEGAGNPLDRNARGAGASIPDKPNFNLRIDKIEIASDDPDRFAMSLENSFEKSVRNPTTSEWQFRTGLG